MKKEVLIILFIALFFFAPFLINPQKLTQKDNDLGRTYIPLFSFIKKTVTTDHEIPIWRPEQMMGESLIANPLSSLFYPVNILFLFFPTDFATVFYLALHVFLASIFTYLLARDFKFSKEASIAGAVFFAYSPKFFLHIASGHITLLAALAYFPLLVLSIRKIVKSNSINWILVSATVLVFMLISHPTIFYYSAIFIFFYAIYLLFENKILTTKRKLFQKKILIISVIPILFFCLSAVALIPQSEFAMISTRSQLTINDVALPIWNHTRFTSSLFFPYIILNSLDAESFLYLGFTVLFFMLVGFIKVSKKSKIIISISFLFMLIFSAGLSTPFFKFFYQFIPLLKYSRITTRLWFGFILLASLLAAYGLDRFKNKKILYLFTAIFLFESFFIGYKKINSTPNLSLSNVSLYQFLASDHDLFRVYCTTYCFNPQLLFKYNIQILNGETPIQQAQFVNFLQKAGNYNYQKFAVIFPPYQVWKTQNPPIPNSQLLKRANVKYIASTYPINESDIQFINKFENIYVYKNVNFQKRIMFLDSEDKIYVVTYKSNSMSLAFPKSENQRTIVIAENYFPGWYAYIDNNKYQVKKYQDVFQQILIPPQVDHVDIKYLPDSFLFGKTITLSSITLLILYFIKKKVKKI